MISIGIQGICTLKRLSLLFTEPDYIITFYYIAILSIMGFIVIKVIAISKLCKLKVANKAWAFGLLQ